MVVVEGGKCPTPRKKGGGNCLGGVCPGNCPGGKYPDPVMSAVDFAVGALPSSTPVTMDAKLSSSRIISAACLLTSDPAIPIATPKHASNLIQLNTYTVHLLTRILRKKLLWFGLVVTRWLDQRSCATSDPVSTSLPGWVTVCGRVNHLGM